MYVNSAVFLGNTSIVQKFIFIFINH